ncbi:hypothetical protein IQ07DRAFT_639943 [Pyrenochaeta sp. DS3sAY3a]|nr:hypothetical protein IQ07DRAFT_639943 [Pyrenochaeta sp. DS3sAY3a]
MSSELLYMFFLLLFGHCASAAVLSAPTPTITPAPLVRRAVTTLGYMSDGTFDGTTIWATITVNDENMIATTRGSMYRVCTPGKCEFWSCSGGWVVKPSSSYFCNTGTFTCSSDIILSDISDQSPLTSYWCDDTTNAGGTIYRTTPDGSVRSSPITPSETPVTPSSSSSSISPSVSPQPTSPKSTPVGAIVGGVVGGIVAIGAIIIGVIFVLRRRRSAGPAQSGSVPAPPTTHYHQGPPGVATQTPQVPPTQYYNAGYPQPEKTPAVATGHVNQYYSDSGPTSPVPQYSANPIPVDMNELPVQRM